MPTGYTYPVAEGKITEFNDFAMLCARGFGALIMMRDDPMDATIPDEIAPSTEYYDTRITADSKLMGQIQAMTNAEADIAAQEAHEEAMRGRAKYLANKELEAARLNAMLMKVRIWQPPTPDHAGMKSFMIEQLTISLPGEYAPAIPAALDGFSWRKSEIERLSESVARNKQQREEEVDRAAGRTKWVKALRQSLTPQSGAA